MRKVNIESCRYFSTRPAYRSINGDPGSQPGEEQGVAKTILFNLCSHGHFDMSAYDQYLSGKLVEHEVTQAESLESLAELDTPLIA